MKILLDKNQNMNKKCRAESRKRPYEDAVWFPSDPAQWHDRPDKEELEEMLSAARVVILRELQNEKFKVSLSVMSKTTRSKFLII